MTRFRLLFVFLVVVVALAGAIAVSATNRNFIAPLSGGEEVPPTDTRAASVAKLQVSKEGDALRFKLIVANIMDVTQAHIHCGPEGVNGPVVALLYGLGPTVTVNGILAEGVITDANIIPRPDSAACSGGVSDLDDVLEKLESGGAYVNVHTVVYPGGEIRGQVR